MKLNNKGQCPICLVKPLVYKREQKCFCSRCDRTFELGTGEWIANFAWQGPDVPTQHHLFYGEPVFATDGFWFNVVDHPGGNLPTKIFYKMKHEKHLQLINHDVPVGDERQNSKYEAWMKNWQRMPTGKMIWANARKISDEIMQAGGTFLYPNNTRMKLTGDPKVIKQILARLDGLKIDYVPTT